MKTHILLVLFSSLIYFSASAQVESIESDNPENRSLRDFEMTKSPALGYPPSETMQAIRNSLNQPQSLISSCPNDWTERGPGNVGGRTRAIMFDPNDGGNGFKKVWACGVAGGLWYRDDITVASSSNPWTHVSDFWDNLAITALTFDPNNIQNFYVGTGEGWFNSDAVRGGGIWFSDQAGNAGTWNQIPWSDPSDATYGGDFLYIQKIVVYNGYAYVATLSGLWQFPVPANSVPTKVLGAGTGYGIDRIADIEIGASGNLFVSTGIRSTDGIYRRPSSTVGAGGWTKLNVGGSGLPTINFQRIELACAASNSQIAYAMVETTAPLDVKIYKTSNANATIPFWTQCGVPTWHNDEIPTTQSCVPVASDISRGHAFYDLIIQVDPLDENNVYMGAIDLFRSTNGGTIWNQISEWTRPGSGYNCGLPYVHADQHNIQFRPGQTGASSNQILFSNDGGVYYTTNGGTGFLEENYNYNVTQLYSCALNPAGSVVGANPNNFLAGTQDNGSQWFNAAGIDFSTDMVNGGDGALCFIDQEQPDYQIVSYLLDNFYRSSNGTTTHTFGTMYWNDFHDNVGCNLVNGYNTLWIDPADYDTRNNTLFFGSGLGDGSPCGLCLLDVGYSDDVNGVNSSFARQPIDALSFCNDPNAFAVTAIKVSPYSVLGSTTLFAGTFQGRLYRIDNAQSGTPVATEISIPYMVANSCYISCIEIGVDENQILVIASNYGIESVWETTDGSTWVSKDDGMATSNLPDMPIRWALYNHNDWREVMLATEAGVWTTDDISVAHPDWNYDALSGLSRVRVDMLKTRASDNIVAAATHGRGLFTSDCAFGHAVAAFNTDCGSLTVNFTDLSSNNVNYWSWNFGDGGSSTAQNPSHTYATTGSFIVTLEVTNLKCPSCTSTVQRTIIVGSAPPFVTVTPTSASICAGANLTLTANGALTYSWSNSQSLNNSFGAQVIAFPTTSTTYTVTGVDANGCMATAQTTITVSPSPNVNIFGVLAICEGAPVVINAAPNNYPSYLWTPGGMTTPVVTVYPTAASPTFTVVVTNANGCTASATVTFPIVPYVVNITNNPSLNICEGSSTTLTANASNAASYLWNPGAINTQAISVSPNVTTPYTVVVTSSNGCTGTATVTVTVDPNPIVDAGPPQTICTGTTATMNGSITGATLASWSSTGLGIFSPPNALNAVYIPDPLDHGVITITLTSTDPPGVCGPISATTQLTIDAACCGTFLNEIHQSDFDNLTYISGSWNLNSNIVLTHSVTLLNCTLSIAEGFSITVPANLSLTIQTSHLKACGNMWRGIDVKDNGIIRVHMLSIIEDAEIAITMEGNGTLVTSNSFFNDNYVGIWCPLGFYHSFIPTIEYTTFQGLNPLAPPYTGHTFTIGTIPFAGIYLGTATAFNIGTFGSSSFYNVFKNMNYGIVAVSSNVMVQNSKFIDIYPDPLYTFSGSNGTAISTALGSLIVSGWGKSSGLTNFSGCKYGIFVSDAEVTIKGNIFDHSASFNSEEAVKINGCWTRNINVNYNKITAAYTGVGLYFNDGSANLLVNENDIDIGSHAVIGNIPPVGIDIGENLSANNNSRVFNNKVIMQQNAFRGISLRTAKGYHINNNQITMLHNLTNMEGIISESTDRCYIDCNNITGQPNIYLNLLQHAIGVLKSSNLTVGCNYVANAYQGIYVNGNCPAMLMQGNLIDKNKYGLYYGSSITVSNQFLTGNEFRNQASNYSSTAAFKVTGPAFYTLIPGSIHLNYQFTPPSQTPGNFFVPVTQGTNFQCLIQQSFDYCGVTHQEPREKDGLDDKIANREIEPEFFEDETYYQLDQYLFSKLKENSAMRDTDTTMQSYFLQMQNNVIADFSDVKDQADEMLSIDQVATVTLEQNNSAIDALQLNVESIQNQFQNDNLTNQEVEQLTNNIITSEQSIQTLRSLNNDIVEQLKSGRLLSAAQISQINGSIGTTELIASNDKAINEICLATISIGEFNFSQAQGSTILSIAQQCPISGGEAVYRARSLYKLIDPTMIYDDINTCLQEGIIYRKAHPNSNNVIYAFVIPNPALNFAELQYSIIAENADVVFYNTIGQKIDRINLNCKMNVLSLNLDQFENGVYFFQIIADGKPGINGKLIVQK